MAEEITKDPFEDYYKVEVSKKTEKGVCMVMVMVSPAMIRGAANPTMALGTMIKDALLKVEDLIRKNK